MVAQRDALPGGGQRTQQRRIALAVLALLVIASVAVRVPWLERPLSGHHEEGTARVLRTIQAWETDDVSRAALALRMSYENPGDFGVDNLGRVRDPRGVYYYTSYPPLHSIAPYLAFRALGVAPSIVAVRLFNIALHLLGAALLWVLARRSMRGAHAETPALWGSVAAVAAYLFAPIALWFYGNAYVTESLALPFFIMAVLGAVTVLEDERPSSAPAPAPAPAPGWAMLAAGALLMSYTSWLGLSFAAAAVLLALVRRTWRHAAVAGVASVMAAVALAVTVAQYSAVVGFGSLVAQLTGAAAQRSGMTAASADLITVPYNWYRLGNWYFESLLPVLLALLALGALAALAARGIAWRGREGFSAGEIRWPRTALGLSLTAVVIHHVVLFEHSVVHDFSVLKAVLPVSLALGVLVGHLAGYERRRGWIVGLLGVMIVGSIGQWYVINRGPVSGIERIGVAIARTQSPDRVIFIDHPVYYLGHSAVFYAGRNIARWESAAAARAQIREAGVEGGMVYVLDEAETRVERIDLVDAAGRRVPSGIAVPGP